MILRTPRLELSELAAADAPFILVLLNEPSFIQNIGDRGVRTIDDARDYIGNGPAASYARHGFGLYRVGLRETGEAIGICGLLRRDALPDPDLGFAFLPAYWRHGYARESAEAVQRFARETLGIGRLLAITNPANQPSIRLLESLGFHFEAMTRLSADGPELKLFAQPAPDSSNGQLTPRG
jgi:RimJ/RimL family protein N-acetyltransferase